MGKNCTALLHHHRTLPKTKRIKKWGRQVGSKVTYEVPIVCNRASQQSGGAQRHQPVQSMLLSPLFSNLALNFWVVDV